MTPPPASVNPRPPAWRLPLLLAILTATASTYAYLWRTRSDFERDSINGIRTLLPGHRSPLPPGPDIFKEDGRRYLSGVGHESEHAHEAHFDVTDFRLDPIQLRHGLGREHFAALVEPEFVSVADARWLHDRTLVLTLAVEDAARVYPLPDLRRHEVVNDEVGGLPVFAAYCVLANLGAVYDRRVEGHTLTFAVSGYTYFDPDVWDGLNAFVLWDRDTESLWWPPIGRAVSGPMIDAPLKILDQALWSQTTWLDAKTRYPHARVLQHHQTFTRPQTWPPLELAKPSPRPATIDPNWIAPRWGDNPPNQEH